MASDTVSTSNDPPEPQLRSRGRWTLTYRILALNLLTVLLVAAIQVIDPDYLQPMFRGWGPIVLACTAGSVLMGVTVIRRMVRIEV